MNTFKTLRVLAFLAAFLAASLVSPAILPSLVFLLVYAAVLTFDISYYELRGINTDRVHIILLPTIIYVYSFFTLAPRPWSGVDEAVVEKVAREHGREAKKPLLDVEGDLLLFVFLIAGTIGGFAAGYYWRILIVERAPKIYKEKP